MGLLDALTGKKEIKKLTSQIQELQNRNLFGGIKPQNLAIYPSWDTATQIARYTDTDDIYSIVRLLSTTAALIPLYGYLQTPDIKSFNKLAREQKRLKEFNPALLRQIQTKALTDLPDSDPVAILLENPHEKMSKYEFFESVFSFLFLSGEVFILKERPELGANAGKPIQLHIMFPQNVTMKVSGLPREIISYDYRIEGQKVLEDIPAADVIHIKYWNPEQTWGGNELRGLSPLKVLKRRLTRLDSNMDVSVAQMQNGGVETIVYTKGASDEEAAKRAGQRKDNFYKFLSNKSNAGAPFFASEEMGAIQLGSHLADIQVLALANMDFKKLCNIYGVSDVLFNSDSASTESNVQIHTKRLYTNTVLPNVFRVRDALIKGLLPDFKDGVTLTDMEGNTSKVAGDGKMRYIDADISDITELHEDIGRKATWMASAYWLTNNEKREMMNYGKYDDPIFDEPLIPAGLQTLSDFETMPPLPVVTPNGN